MPLVRAAAAPQPVLSQTADFRLAIESESSVRDALFSSLITIGGPHAAHAIGPFVHSNDAGMRGGAIEALKRLGEDAVSTLDTLLVDPDPDTRLLAVEVTRAWSSALAVPRLQLVMEADEHVNVCGAAVEVATEVGTEILLAPLAALRARFAGDQFLTFAIDVACSRIQAAKLRED
jgi:HEAT repeat protein